MQLVRYHQLHKHNIPVTVCTSGKMAVAPWKPKGSSPDSPLDPPPEENSSPLACRSPWGSDCSSPSRGGPWSLALAALVGVASAGLVDKAEAAELVETVENEFTLLQRRERRGVHGLGLPLKLCLHESSNPGSTHFRSQTKLQSTNGCGLSQSGLQSGLGAFTLEVNPGYNSGLNSTTTMNLNILLHTRKLMVGKVQWFYIAPYTVQQA